MKSNAYLKINLWVFSYIIMKKTAIITKYSIFLLNCTLPEESRTMMQRSKWFHLSCAPQVNSAKLFWMPEALHVEMYRFETPSPLVQDCSLLSHSIKHPAAPPAPAWSLLERHSPASTQAQRASDVHVLQAHIHSFEMGWSDTGKNIP